MQDPGRTPNTRAVFLSYTSEDLAIALAMCEALREAGIEVWMDQSELQGGDAWDAHIRRQIRECALIIPIISARTQGRREGYFRLEWRLADERMQLLAEGTPLILPVVADETRQADALVPKSFLSVQWSRLPHGNVPPALVLRVKKLLGLESAASATIPPQGIQPGSSLPAATPLPATPGKALTTSDGADEMELLVEVEHVAVRQMRPSGSASALPRRSAIPIAVTAIVALGAGILGTWFLRPQPKPEPKLVNRFSHEIPSSNPFRNSGRNVIALSPDGRSFVYNSTQGLLIRNLGETKARVIPGTEEILVGPVFSPDGQSVAYFVPTTGATTAGAPGELRRTSVNGGAPVSIATATNHYGISWESDGTILYGQPDGIYRVSATGGTPQRIIPSDAGELLATPQLLPGGKTVLFCSSKSGKLSVEVFNLSSGQRKVVIPGGKAARYVPATGHLLYVVESDLFGIAFDADALATTGGAVSLVQDVRPSDGASSALLSNYAVAGDGTLLYLTGTSIYPRILVWVDRQGKEEPLKLEAGDYQYARLSPDATKVVVSQEARASTSSPEVLVWDLATQTRTRLTLGEAGGRHSLWSPEGTRIIYNSLDGKLSVKPVNNTRPPEVLVNSFEGGPSELWPVSWTPDKRSIIFERGELGGDVGMISTEPGAKPRWLLNSPFFESGAVLSPDGKWLAYYSNESGRGYQVYVSPFPNVDEDKVPVSNEGGSKPLWSPDGNELFFVSGTGGASAATSQLMSAKVQVNGSKFTVVARNPVWSSPLRALHYMFERGVLRNYEIHPDGQRFLMFKQVRGDGGGDAPEQIFIVQNWTEELKRRVPGAKK